MRGSKDDERAEKGLQTAVCCSKEGTAVAESLSRQASGGRALLRGWVWGSTGCALSRGETLVGILPAHCLVLSMAGVWACLSGQHPHGQVSGTRTPFLLCLLC